MKTLWIFLLLISLLATSSIAFPLFGGSSATEDITLADPAVIIHHRHKKHHIRNKHRRRSLSSKEDAKARRNKQVMLTKPYWPWP